MSVLESVGNTPLVELKRVNSNPKVRVLAKLEGANPGGSVKDRIALAMVSDAVEKGFLGNGKTILEATSGNTGIGLAMVGASMGIPGRLTMPECVSMERRRVLEALGAEVVMTVETNPSLIGGVEIRAGDLVIDGSVRGKLHKLATELQI